MCRTTESPLFRIWWAAKEALKTGRIDDRNRLIDHCRISVRVREEVGLVKLFVLSETINVTIVGLIYLWIQPPLTWQKSGSNGGVSKEKDRGWA